MTKIRKYFFINHKYIVVPCQDAFGAIACKSMIQIWGCKDAKVIDNCQKSCDLCIDGK